MLIKIPNKDKQWLYLLTYLKCKLFEQEINQEDFDFVKHEKVMVTELRTKKAIPFANLKQVQRLSKRKLKDPNEEGPCPKKQKVSPMNIEEISFQLVHFWKC